MRICHCPFPWVCQTPVSCSLPSRTASPRIPYKPPFPSGLAVNGNHGKLTASSVTVKRISPARKALAISPPLFSTSFAKFSNASGVNSSFGMLTVNLFSVCSASPMKPFPFRYSKRLLTVSLSTLSGMRSVPSLSNVQSPIL